MKKIVFLVTFLVLSLTAILIAGAVISDFRAEAGLNRVELKWIVTAESNLRGYQLLRSMDGANFEALAFVPVKLEQSGEKTYTYIDKSVFKGAGHSFYYKLQLVNSDGSTTDFERVVSSTPQISATRHTWGSIKAMFR